jgi:hypothetical protein
MFFERSRLLRSPLPLVISIAALVLLPSTLFAQTGFRFLELGVGGRAAAMGDAYTSIASDGTAVYWNPAGLARMEGIQLNLAHAEWFEGVRHEYVGAGKRMGRHAIGGAFSGVFTGSIDRRDDKGRQTGTYGYYDMAAAVSYAYEARPDIWVGGTFKYLREGIDNHSGDGFAADFGFQWALPWEGVMAGAALRHVGPGITVNAEETKLPTVVQGGVSFSRLLQASGGTVLVSIEARKSREDDTNFLYGMEYIFPQGFAAQAGYRSGMDSADLSFGARLSRDMYTFSYAYVPYSDLVDVGDTHRISLGISFL